MENLIFFLLALITILLFLVVGQSLLSPKTEGGQSIQMDDSIPLHKKRVLESLEIISILFIGFVVTTLTILLLEMAFLSVLDTIHDKVNFL